jgi:hypothetical protein
MERQADGETGRWRDGQIDRRTFIKTDCQMKDGCTDRQKDG